MFPRYLITFTLPDGSTDTYGYQGDELDDYLERMLLRLKAVDLNVKPFTWKRGHEAIN